MDEGLKNNRIYFNQFTKFYFVGIAGAGMSALAQMMHEAGYQVAGSDINNNGVMQQLARSGITIVLGHVTEVIKNYEVVVTSSAIVNNNPELLLAMAHKKIIITRGELLAILIRSYISIAIAGSHGKTTTASLLVSILSEANYDPSYAIGVQPTPQKNNYRLGESPYFILEVDESDASFLKTSPMFSIITSIDADHLNHYNKKLSGLIHAFSSWLNKIPFYGLSLLCQDDVHIQQLLSNIDKPYYTYGYSKQSDIVIDQVCNQDNYSSFVVTAPILNKEISVSFPMLGQHNVLNATAAIALAWHLKISNSVIARALMKFQGVYRRFQCYQKLPQLPQKTVLIDDYGHHPKEIEVMLNTIGSIWSQRRLIVFFQPHRYTRTQALFDEFIRVLSTDNVAQLYLVEEYAASEQYIDGATSNALSQALQKRREGKVQYLLKTDVLFTLQNVIKKEDVILFQGAGDLSFLLQELGAEAMLNGKGK